MPGVDFFQIDLRLSLMPMIVTRPRVNAAPHIPEDDVPIEEY